MKTTPLIDRRTALRQLATAGAGLGLFHIVPAWGQARPAPSNRLVLGAVGLGGMGRGNLGGFLGRPDVQVVGLCDVDANHLAGAKKQVDDHYGNAACATYGDYRDLLARGDLDAVSMATPDHWHGRVAVAAAAAGCDMYGEKPLTHSLGEGRALVDAFDSRGLVWQTGSWQRSVTAFWEAACRVRAGRLGRVVRIEVGLPTGARSSGPVSFPAVPPELDYERWVGPAPYHTYCPNYVHGNWRWKLDYGGGQLMDWIGHHGDIAHWGMGWDHTGPVSAEGTAAWPSDGVWDAPSTYRGRCQYADGTEVVVANAEGDLWMGCKWFNAAGEWLWVDRGGLDSEPKSVLAEPLSESEMVLPRSTDHIGNFITAVKERGATITPAETAHRSASLGHLCQVAFITGRRILFDPTTERVANDPTAQGLLNPPHRAPWG